MNKDVVFTSEYALQKVESWNCSHRNIYKKGTFISLCYIIHCWNIFIISSLYIGIHHLVDQMNTFAILSTSSIHSFSFAFLRDSYFVSKSDINAWLNLFTRWSTCVKTSRLQSYKHFNCFNCLSLCLGKLRKIEFNIL